MRTCDGLQGEGCGQSPVLDLRGDIGTVVLLHDDRGYEVEFMTLDGETLGVVSLLPHQVRPIGRREIAQARMVSADSASAH